MFYFKFIFNMKKMWRNKIEKEKNARLQKTRDWFANKLARDRVR